MIRAVYFDLDDTLCAYWAASAKGLREAFQEAEIDPDIGIAEWRTVFPTFAKEIKTDAWYAHYLESGEKTRTEHLRRTLERLSRNEEHLASRISERYAHLRNEYLVLFPDALPLLESLQSRFPLGVITNGPADIQRQEIARLGIERFFGQVLIEGEFKLGKPNPEIFEAAERHCGLAPEEMLFVGNAYEHDVQGAKTAGWEALWLNRGSEESVLKQPEPNRTISNLYEVCDYLNIERPTQELPSIPAELVTNWR